MITWFHFKPTICAWLLALIAAFPAASVGRAAEDSQPGADAVETGRKALDNWLDYPWYDDSADGVAAVDVSPPANYSWLADVLYWAAWVGLALVVGLLLYFLIRIFLDRDLKLTRVSQHDEDQPLYLAADRVEALPFRLDSKGPISDLLAEAQRQYAAGNYDQAIIYLYSFKLMELDKQHVIHLTRGKTNRQYLRETRRKSQLGDLLERTMVAFEDVFFGNHPLSRLRFDECWSSVEQFQSQLRRETSR